MAFISPRWGGEGFQSESEQINYLERHLLYAIMSRPVGLNAILFFEEKGMHRRAGREHGDSSEEYEKGSWWVSAP